MECSHEDHSSSISSRRQMAQFFDRLYGRRNGIVRCALGVDGRFNDRGTYETKWREDSYKWPERRRQLIRDAISDSSFAEVYVRTTLRAGHHPGKKGNGLGGQFIWADLDHVTSRTRRRLDEVLSVGSFIVHSGQPDHLHIYVKLKAVYRAEVVEGLNRQLDHFLGGDGKWAENTVLRVPGTYNHKGRAAGEESYPVTFEEITDSEITPWSPKELRRLLGPLPAGRNSGKGTRSAADTKRSTKKSRRVRQINPVAPESIPSGLPDEVMALVHFDSDATTSRGDHSRSGQLYRLVAALMEHGCSNGEVMGVALLSEPGQEKYPDDSDLMWEIQRCIDKVRPNHPHSGFTCEQAACRVVVHPETEKIANGIRSHFHSHYSKARSLSSDAKVLDALLRRSVLIGDLKLDMSRRQLSRLAGVCRNTADHSLARLVKAGYVAVLRSKGGNPVRRGKGDPAGRAYRYRLIPHHPNVEPHSSSNREVEGIYKKEYMWACGSTMTLDPSHDVWRFRGLAKARRTYEILCSGVSSAKEIAEVHGRTVQTINRHLDLLASVGLAERKPDGKTWIALDRDADELADELGTLGIGEDQAKHHKWETEKYATHRALREDERVEEENQMFQELLDRGFQWTDNHILVPPGKTPKKKALKKKRG